MIRLVQRKLIIPRGDTGSFTIPAINDISQSSVAVFTIFDPLTHGKVMQKVLNATDNAFVVEFNHSDTVNLPVGDFVWDIKFYANPVFADGELIDGEEIDSYYAAFKLPVCEIRQTGDNLIMSDRAPQGTLAPDQIDMLTAVANEAKAATEQARAATEATQEVVDVAREVNEKFDSLAEWVKEPEKPVYTYDEVGALAANTFIPSKVSDLTDDSGHYVKPANGIPASDLEEEYLTEHQDLSNYVQKTDYATANTPGVIRVGQGSGLSMEAGVSLAVMGANSTEVKTGTNPTKPIVPSKQHASTFYGLAKAAGDSTQSQSDNVVGQYTDEAKTAIQNMLDVPSKADIPEVPVQDVQVNGTSALDENGVANIPVGANGVLGVVKAQVGEGILISSGTLKLSTPSSIEVKNGDNGKKAIVPYNQHNATFYGLAKAAGVDEKNSELPVGQYTDSAKTAIQQMLDVPSTSAVTSEIATAIGNINSFDIAVVQELPSQDISTHTIYLVPKTGNTNDVYDEYVYINSNWEMVGNTQIDLSNYVQKTDYATSLEAGVVKTYTSGGAYGVYLDSYKTLKIWPSRSADIKNPSNSNFAPIIPVTQHYAAFYGLAKAAGDTTQSQSDNAVGTYTAEAQAAIQNMLDVPAKADIPDLSNYVQKTDIVNSIPQNGTNPVSGGAIYNALMYQMGTTLDQVKSGTIATRAITPALQDTSTFYGLAKAAGDTTQSQSNNAVGAYTDEAKAAIQTMLDVPSNANLSLKADKTDTVLETTLSRGRKDNTTVGGASLAFGIDTEASGYYSVALGLNTTASSQGAYAEGKNTVAHYIAHAEGEDSQALGQWSHAQNLGTIANGGASSASGRHTIANGADSFVIGKYNAEDSYDNWPTWTANTSYEVGDRVKRNLMVQNEPTDVGYHCTVANNDATFDNAHWELDGYHMNYVEIVGNGKEYEDPETHQTVRAGSNAYALEWNGTGHFAGDVYVGANADSSGGTKVATVNDIPDTSIYATKADTVLETTLSRGRKEGSIIGSVSVALGNDVEASGTASYAEGSFTIANLSGMHAAGVYNVPASKYPGWIAGKQYFVGDKIFYQDFGLGLVCTIENSDDTFNFAKWRFLSNQGELAYVFGNGNSTTTRSNAYALDWDGNGHYMGDIYVGANADSSGGTKVATVTELATKLDAAEAGLKVVRLI